MSTNLMKVLNMFEVFLLFNFFHLFLFAAFIWLKGVKTTVFITQVFITLHIFIGLL